jgi:hypothetical protein
MRVVTMVSVLDIFEFNIWLVKTKSLNLPAESRLRQMKKITNGQGDDKTSRGSERKGKIHDNLDLVNRMIKDGLSDTYIRYHLTAETVGRKKKILTRRITIHNEGRTDTTPVIVTLSTADD